MSLFRHAGRRASGNLRLAVFLVATLALSTWLAFQAWDAARSHRRTAEGVLRDYAGLAAWEYSREAADGLDDFFHVLLDARRRGEWRSRSARSIAREMDDALEDARCRCPGLRDRSAYFQIALRDRPPDAGNLPATTSTVPDSLAPALLRELERLIVDDHDPASREPYGVLAAAKLEALEGPALVAYSMSPDSAEAHGILTDHMAIAQLFARLYERETLLPPTFAADLPNDSVLTLTVRAPEGPTIFASPTTWPSTFAAEETLDDALGGLVVQAAIRPDAAERLIIGGLPRSRLPLLGTLIVFTLAIGLAALIQIRREHELARLREDFVSGVSHEFRTPLTQIRMFSELLDDGKLPTEGERARSIGIINREARRLSHLVENVLKFSELRRNGDAPRKLEEVDIATVVEDVFAAFRPQARASGAALVSDVPPGSLLRCERASVQQILTNLLDNALKYGPTGQTVRVAAERADGTLRISVTDGGPGIDPDDRERIWEPYRRLDRDVAGHVRGSGLGLAVVDRLVARHGGRARVEAGEAGGARFVVELPATRGPAGARAGA